MKKDLIHEMMQTMINNAQDISLMDMRRLNEQVGYHQMSPPPEECHPSWVNPRNLPLYQQEFGQEFKLGHGITIPEEWEDTSWHNDAMPSWLIPSLDLRIWIDWIDPLQSDIGCDLEKGKPYERFSLDYLNPITDEGRPILSTNDWKQLMLAVEAYRTITENTYSVTISYFNIGTNDWWSQTFNVSREHYQNLDKVWDNHNQYYYNTNRRILRIDRVVKDQ